MTTEKPHYFSLSRPKLSATAACLVVFVIAGCKTNQAGSNEPASQNSSSAAQPQAGVVEREQMQVSVTGADATQSGDTLTIDYPVLRDMNDRIPDWVINPAIGGVIGAVGVASRKAIGMREQIEEARLSGRLEIASMLETRLQAVGRGELQEDVRATGNGKSEQARKNVLAVDRDILDVVLAGSRQRALWFDPESGECFVWIVLDGKVLNSVQHEVVDTVSTFVATVAVSSEYRPQRTAPQIPQVVVEAAAPRPQPQEPSAPGTPIEQLEGNLKPIKTISIKKDGDGSGGF